MDKLVDPVNIALLVPTCFGTIILTTALMFRRKPIAEILERLGRNPEFKQSQLVACALLVVGGATAIAVLRGWQMALYALTLPLLFGLGFQELVVRHVRANMSRFLS